MKQEDLISEISELERNIASLPQGSITKKNIKGKDYFYHRITKNGKRNEIYISFENLSDLQNQIERRKELERKLKELLKYVTTDKTDMFEKNVRFQTYVRTGTQLKALVSPVSFFKKRYCFEKLYQYVLGARQEKVFVLYGLRRTGKTTMIRQVIGELDDIEFSKAAFIQVGAGDTLQDLNSDLSILEKMGYEYIFIDEVTMLEDFIEGAAVFSDIYVSSGMRIVLSGTDSLGFTFSQDSQLYDRCIMLHTTFISYHEFEEVLGISGIDKYISYGGTMSLSGINYNTDSPFATATKTTEYIDSAIAKNIQHSLKLYQYGGHFRELLDLYEKGELTNVINRVVENINHSFTKEVVEKTFKSHDISVTAANMMRDSEKPIDILKHMNIEDITKGIMEILEILNKEAQSVDIDSTHMSQIEEYLKYLDLIDYIDLEYLPKVNRKGKLTVVTQPGLRYAQAEAIVETLLQDAKFNNLSVWERQRILERLLSEIRGRMMEEIILLETKYAFPDKKVFKLQFAVGEFDMIVFNPKELNCRIYEVKYSKECVPDQYRHLKDDEKTGLTTHRYGNIMGRYVIYRGESKSTEDIEYINVEEYLRNLPIKAVI